MKDQRKFQRVQVSRALAELAVELHAQVTWPNLETSEVVDLSYKGLAARRPGLFPINAQQNVRLEVTLGHLQPFACEARIAWCNLDWVGLQFGAIPAEGHFALAEFLDAKLVGAMMKPVERVLISGGEDFRYWYHGPGQTHVYIWMLKERVERVRVELDGELAEFSASQRSLSLGRVERRALLVLSQMDKPGLPMEDFVRHLLTGA